MVNELDGASRSGMEGLMNRIYLDNHASTEVDPRVAQAMAEAGFGNPHSDHAVGWEAAAKIDEARAGIAMLIGANHEEIIFTSGATEANNLAILGMRRKAAEGRNKIIRSAIEHKSVIAACDHLRAEWGFEITVLPVSSEGMVDLDALEAALDERTALCTVGFVNNEIGTIQDVRSIGRLCRDASVPLHTDAVQAPLAADISDLARWCDLISLSSHKMHGPMGVGALFIAGDIQHAIAPIMFGGGQQSSLRPGTLPLQLCVGMGTAAQLCLKNEVWRNNITQTRDAFLDELRALGMQFHLNGPEPGPFRHPGNANISFPGIEADELIGLLQPQLAASSGSACTAGTIEPSYVLTALGLPTDQVRSAVRFGFAMKMDPAKAREAALLVSDAAERCT
ncbi:cysteine desulfurase family protein [Nitratireductor sp. ZSWI3]|uniref:cysteine desulfurase family protein n=1 Tax=Nitratireductor sp. ZSWI3 TaxID=2966359 RepID=UPI00214FC7E0|nr:cysteine desulfurase family protein [Nitratireductor sp. ZSWI3]MCR4266774.1 cysteine desulfurase [Nitratireductor sp. ZSWI3]